MSNMYHTCNQYDYILHAAPNVSCLSNLENREFDHVLQLSLLPIATSNSIKVLYSIKVFSKSILRLVYCIIHSKEAISHIRLSSGLWRNRLCRMNLYHPCLLNERLIFTWSVGKKRKNCSHGHCTIILKRLKQYQQHQAECTNLRSSHTPVDHYTTITDNLFRGPSGCLSEWV